MKWCWLDFLGVPKKQIWDAPVAIYVSGPCLAEEWEAEAACHSVNLGLHRYDRLWPMWQKQAGGATLLGRSGAGLLWFLRRFGIYSWSGNCWRSLSADCHNNRLDSQMSIQLSWSLLTISYAMNTPWLMNNIHMYIGFAFLILLLTNFMCHPTVTPTCL